MCRSCFDVRGRIAEANQRIAFYTRLRSERLAQYNADVAVAGHDIQRLLTLAHEMSEDTTLLDAQLAHAERDLEIWSAV